MTNKILSILPTYIPAAPYFSKSQAAAILNIPVGTLQWHIGQGNIESINFPGLGHLINEWDVLEFKKKLAEIKQGRPSVYKKKKVRKLDWNTFFETGQKVWHKEEK